MRNGNQNTQGYSTSRSSQSYYTSQNSKKDKYSNRYNGPTAKRTYTNTNKQSSGASSSSSNETYGTYANSTSSQSDVVEVPLLEVSDVSQDNK